MDNKTGKTVTLVIAIVLLIPALLWSMRLVWPYIGIDWKETFYPASRAVLQGKSPYIVPTFRNVPWTILPLLPFALLPEDIGGMILTLLSLIVYAWTAYCLKASRVGLIAFLLSPPVVYGMRMLNVDVFALLGFVLPAPVGLFFVVIKPQMGIAMILFWFVEAWREGGTNSVLRTFAPVTAALGLSFILFGNWPAGR